MSCKRAGWGARGLRSRKSCGSFDDRKAQGSGDPRNEAARTRPLHVTRAALRSSPGNGSTAALAHELRRSAARRLPEGTCVPMVDRKPTTSWAVVSLVCSILGCLGIVALPASYSHGLHQEPTGVTAG